MRFQRGFLWAITVLLMPLVAICEVTPSMPCIEMDRANMLLMMSGDWVSRAIYVAAKLELADHLEKGPKSIEELATLSGSDPESLLRLVKMLAVFGIFEEVSPQVIGNTEASRFLTKSNPETLRGLSIFYGEDMRRAMDELLPAVETGKPAFDIAFKEPVFRFFKENPERAALFHEAMKEKSTAVIKSILTVYDFSSLKTVYDIGGGYGAFIEALFAKYPRIEGHLFELPEVIEVVKKRHPHFEKRSALIAGDFFAAVPRGGDLYFLKSVLHDWDDVQCEKILKNCAEAMEANSRLLIAEIVLESSEDCTYAHCMDLLMMAVTGGKERSLSSFEKMAENAGLSLTKVYPTSTEFSLLELRKK